MTKKEKVHGITLIALVITIIVLIILAGVSINLIIGNNGLISKAIEGSDTYKEEQFNEKMQLMLADYTAELMANGITLNEYLDKKGIQYRTDDKGNIIITQDGHMLTIDPITLKSNVIEKEINKSIIALPSVAEYQGSLTAQIEFGEGVDIENCKYAYVKKGETELTSEEITTNLPASTKNENTIYVEIPLSTQNVGDYEFYVFIKYKDGTESIIKKRDIIVGTIITNVILNKENTQIAKGKTETLQATLEPENPSKTDIQWTTSNSNVATVNNQGLVTGKDTGTAIITATATDGSGKKAECNVEVYTIPVSEITLNKDNISLLRKSTDNTLIATVSPEDATNPNVEWSSNDTTIATVDAETGVITGVKAGTTTIVATATDGSGKTAECEITVEPILVTGITLNKTTASVAVSKTVTISATVTPSDADNTGVTWSSDKTNIATVNENGVVTGKAKGSAVITATAKDGSNVKATCTVNVSDNNLVIYENGKINSDAIGTFTATTYRISYWGGDSAKPQITTSPNLKVYEPGSSNPQGTAIGSKAINLSNYKTLSFNVTNIAWRKSNARIYVGFTTKYGTNYSVAASKQIAYNTTTTGTYTCDVSGLTGNHYFIVAMSSQGSIEFSSIKLLP